MLYNYIMASGITRFGKNAPIAKRRGTGTRRRWKTIAAAVLLAFLSVMAILLVAFGAIFWRFTKDLPNLEVVVNDIKPPNATEIYSQDGELLGKLRVENRQPIQSLKELPTFVKDATLAIEDHRFYQHSGVDLKGTMRALWVNVSSGRAAAQGGSTLTQQLVRNLKQFGVTKEKRFERKIKEAFIALRLEQIYTKDQILLHYLNNIYYGRGAYGVDAAARVFFGKPAKELSLSQAALLAGLAQRPSDYARTEQRKVALDRRDDVLGKMREYGYINDQQLSAAKQDLAKFIPPPKQIRSDFKAPYFVNYVLKQLTKQFGSDYLYSGLKIETTLNYKMQQLGDEIVRKGLDKSEGVGANKGALVSIDNQSGYIRAMVGGRNFYVDQFNAVTQGRRQPGSTFKVFDYTAAFERGEADLNTSFMDEPIPYPNDPEHFVKNYDGKYSRGRISCLSAIQWSKNTIAVQVAKKIGMDKVIAIAHKMGITTEIAPYLPAALGASAVRPIELASAYSVFPTGGRRFLPMSIVRVTDSNGDVVLENLPSITEPILKQSTVEQMDKALEAVVTSGTGTRARGYGDIGVVEGARGKTGTTSDNRDAWFAGYTPELTTVIWVASEQKRNGKITYAEMPGATGGHLCAPMWHDFMIQAIPEQRRTKVNIPGITVTQEQADQKIALDPDKKPKKKKAEAKPKPTAEQNAPEPTPEETDENQELDPRMNAPEGAPPEAAPPPATRNRDPDGTEPKPEKADPDAKETTALPPRIRTAESLAPNHAAMPAKNSGALTTSVRICTDSGRIASKYCPDVHKKRLSAEKRAALGFCNLHQVPPGEEE